MTGVVVCIGVLLIRATAPNEAISRTELVGFAITFGLVIGGPIWLVAWMIEAWQNRNRR